jgi:hypothetical protein
MNSREAFDEFCDIVHPVEYDAVRKIQDHDVWICSEASFRQRVLELIGEAMSTGKNVAPDELAAAIMALE